MHTPYGVFNTEVAEGYKLLKVTVPVSLETQHQGNTVYAQFDSGKMEVVSYNLTGEQGRAIMAELEGS